MEESNQSGDLAISGVHGNAQEEYAIRRKRRSIVTLNLSISDLRN